jgi:hypothetical protein
MQESNRLAEKLSAIADDAELAQKAWQAVYTRSPREEEVRSVRTFLERQAAELGSRKAAVVELARVLFNTNEFLYVD